MAAFSVLIGAFGAHLLKKYLSPEIMETFHTGVTYQFFHSLAIIIAGLLLKRYPNNLMMWAGRLFTLGIIFFSGSLYLLVLLQSFKGRGLGAFSMLTPLGGLMFVGGWLAIVMGVPSSKPLGSD